MKPIEIKYNYGIPIAIILIIIAFFGVLDKGIKFFKIVAPEGDFLNWRFVSALCLFVGFIIWFVMNHFWMKEYKKNQTLKFDKENYIELLKISENERLTDIVTGVPNLQSLKSDIENYFNQKQTFRNRQFILIDIKDFRKVNNKYGFLKTNELLRILAQTIYQKMRRNEDMYKYPIDWNKNSGEHFYRIHTGGDEFAFIIEGNQVDALGFANRLVKNEFRTVSRLSKDILGKSINLSFHCAVVEMDSRDSMNDIFRKASDCYLIAKEGKKDFNICWHPNNIEMKFKENWAKEIYKETREIFDVLTVDDSKLF